MSRRESFKEIVRIPAAGLLATCGRRRLAAAATEDILFPHYVDVAEKAGLRAQTIVQTDTNKDFLLSTTGGGVALFDFDNDGWLDIFMVNGWGLDGFPSGNAPSNHLYRNNRNGTFTDVTKRAGLVRRGWGQGVCMGDYDNDGYVDLFVTYYGQNVLYHNNGDGTFTDVTWEAGLLTQEERWNTGAAFLDYDRDGHLDLFVCHYVDYPYGTTLYESNPSLAGNESPVLYGVKGLKGTRSSLYRNNGNGSFTDVSEMAGILKPGKTYGFTPLVADFNDDGWPDVYVADDSTASRLFINNRNGSFSETGLLAGVALDSNGNTQAGMGVAAADYDGDGRLDILKTNFSSEPPTLYHNEGGAFFTDVTFQAGLGGATKSVKWGTAFLDIDNDGHPDIFIASGPIYPPGPSGRHPMTQNGGQKLVFRNTGGGRFEDISAQSGPGISQPHCGRGLAVGDVFHTGQVDVVINNINDRPNLLKNISPSNNNWLLIHLIGTRTNAAAIGSRVWVDAAGSHQVQEVRSGGSFCSQSDLRLHFGLGKAERADRIAVRWLSGLSETFSRIPANHHVTIREGKGIISQESF